VHMPQSDYTFSFAGRLEAKFLIFFLCCAPVIYSDFPANYSSENNMSCLRLIFLPVHLTRYLYILYMLSASLPQAATPPPLPHFVRT